MAFRYDKPYRTNINIDLQKIFDLFNLVYQMDTQEIMQYSLINKIPLSVTLPSNGNNLIHEILSNDDKLKNEFNKLNVIKFLVQNDVNPDEPNKENQTPIHIACQKQYNDIVEFLINECEVSLNYKDNNGFTPLHYLLIGEIKLFDKKEISDLITFQRKGDIVKKDDIIEIKKLIYPLIIKHPFLSSLEKTIYDTLKNNSEIENIILETQNKIQKNISSKEKTNNLKENKEIISIQRNEMKKVVDGLWGKFNDTKKLELHIPKLDSYVVKESDNLGLIKNSNIKKEIKKKLDDNVVDFKKYTDEIIDTQNNIIEMFDSDDFIAKIYNEFVKDSQNIYKNPHTKQLYYDRNSNFFDDDKNIFDEINNDYKFKLAHDFADNIIDLDSNLFYGGSRVISVDFTKAPFDYYKTYVNDKTLNEEINFKKLFIFLIYEKYKASDVQKIKTSEDLDNFLNGLANDVVIEFLKKYINKLFDPDYANEIYCEYTKLLCYNNKIFNDNLSGTINILIMNFMSCLMHKQYTFEHFIANLSFFLVSKKYTVLDYSIKLKLIFAHFVKPLNNFDPININNGLPDNVLEIFNLIDKFITKKENEDIEELIKKINLMVENNLIKVPNIMVADFIYMVKNKVNFLLFDSYYNNNLKYNYIINIINNTIDKISIKNLNIDNKRIYGLLLSQLCPSFQNFFYCLINDKNDDICFSKLLEAINLKLKFRGIIPLLIDDIENKFDHYDHYKISNINKSDFLLKEYNEDEEPNIPPLPGNYYFSKNDIDKNNIPDNYNYYILKKNQYRPPFIYSLYNLQVNQLNTINRLLKDIITNDEQSYYILLNSIKQGKIKDISKYYLDFYYIINCLIINQSEIYKKFEEYHDDKIKIKIFDITKLNNFLNKTNAYVFLYYYLFSGGKEIKIPKFSYFRVDSDKSLIFENNYELVLPDNDPSELEPINKKDLLNQNKIIQNIKKTKSDYFTSYLTNILLDNTIVKNKQYLQEKSETLPPSMEIELGTFYEYNKIILFKNLLNDNSYNQIRDKIKEFVNKTQLTKINDSQREYYLLKIIEEIIKDQSELLTNRAISKILNESKIDKISDDKELFSIGEFRNTQITFDDNIDDDTFANMYLFRNTDVVKDCNFIIYPNEYNNTNILKQMYCLKIDQKILQFLIDKNVDPYSIDDNGNSIISPLEKTYHYESIERLRKNAIDINTFGLPKNPVIQLSNESRNHINKILKGNTYNEFINNFISSQYNEIKVILLSNNRFGYNIVNYLDTSFKTVFYLINEYLTDILWRFSDNYKFEDMNKIFKLTNNDKFYITYNYLFYFIDNKYIPKSNNIIIMKDYLNQLAEEKSNLKTKIKKIDDEIDEINKAKLSKNIFNFKNKRKELIKQQITKGTQYNKINKKIINGLKLNDFNYDKNFKKIIDLYDNFIVINDVGVYLDCWEKLFNSNLSNSWNLDLIKIIIKEKQLLENMNLNEYETINKFYEQLCNLSKIYFEESKYTERNKVLRFVYELLEHMTKTYICYNIEMTLRNLLTKYFMDLNIDNDFDYINKKIDYLLNAENVIDGKKFTDILYNDLPKEFVRNSVDIFYNYNDKNTFEPKSIKEILNDLFNLLTVGDIVNVPSNSQFMQVLNNELTDYFDLFVQKLINNWLVVIENVFKFTINQYRINKCILELLKK